MSKFKTAIPVDVEAVKQLLPAGSFIHGVEWNKDNSSVELTWEHDQFRTKYSFAVDRTIDQLRAERKAEGRVLGAVEQFEKAGGAASTPAPEAAAAAMASGGSPPGDSVPTEPEEVVEKPRRRK